MSNKQIQHFSTVWDVIDDKDSNDGGASDVDNTDGNDCVGGCGGGAVDVVSNSPCKKPNQPSVGCAGGTVG